MQEDPVGETAKMFRRVHEIDAVREVGMLREIDMTMLVERSAADDEAARPVAAIVRDVDHRAVVTRGAFVVQVAGKQRLSDHLHGII